MSTKHDGKWTDCQECRRNANEPQILLTHQEAVADARDWSVQIESPYGDVDSETWDYAFRESLRGEQKRTIRR